MDTVVGHVSRYVQEQNIEKLEAIFDEAQPIGSTNLMRPWLTTKPCMATEHSQISHVVYDSAWEKVVADICEKESHVTAWAKNDHLDFIIRYLWRGSSRNFVPDYLIRLNNGKTLVLEVKGVDSEQNKAKRAAMDTWIKAVNEQGGFGQWCFDVVFEPARTRDILLKHVNEDARYNEKLSPHYIGDKALYFYDEVKQVPGVFEIAKITIGTSINYKFNTTELESYLPKTTWLKYGVCNVEILEEYFNLIGLLKEVIDGEDASEIIWALVDAKQGSTIIDLAIYGVSAAGIYKFVCNYPQFRDGLLAIKDDGEKIINHIKGRSKVYDNKNGLTKIEINELVEKEIEKLNNNSTTKDE